MLKREEAEKLRQSQLEEMKKKEEERKAAEAAAAT